ncbi:MAG: hypothetical protein RL090_1018 [Bacteroidota bacterium]|jgi:hypothetical protein
MENIGVEKAQFSATACYIVKSRYIHYLCI